jgi:hypothetical protein
LASIELINNYENLNELWNRQIAVLDNRTMPFIEAQVGSEDTILYNPIKQLSKTEVTSHRAVGIKLIPLVHGCQTYHVDTVKLYLKQFLVSKQLMRDSETEFPPITKSQFLRVTSAPSVDIGQIDNWLPLRIQQQDGTLRFLTQSEMNWFMCRRYISHNFRDLRPFNPEEKQPHDLGFKDPACQITVSLDMLNRLYNFFISDYVPRQTRAGLDGRGGKKLTKMKKNQRYMSKHIYKRRTQRRCRRATRTRRN